MRILIENRIFCFCSEQLCALEYKGNGTSEMNKHERPTWIHQAANPVFPLSAYFSYWLKEESQDPLPIWWHSRRSASLLGPGWGSCRAETFHAAPGACSPFSSCHPSHVQGFQNTEAEVAESAAAVPANSSLKRLLLSPAQNKCVSFGLGSLLAPAGASRDPCPCSIW